jgi:Holliday junction resolvase-like predicted endonuclease
MRKFSSYGPINRKIHYYAPREGLIQQAMNQLIGDDIDEGGHYITIWAPRQTGKTWIMQQVVRQIYGEGDFEIAIISLQSANIAETDDEVLEIFIDKLQIHFERTFHIDSLRWSQLPKLFTKKIFTKPVILIIDEFDALNDNRINKFANIFRDMYISRQNEMHKKSQDKSCLLHGLALIGVRSVLGIENVKGSPFNVQRSLHIPNLTFDEVKSIYQWYEKERNQQIDPDVIERIFYEFNGQPGLTCWFGEQLTEVYNTDLTKSITMQQFEKVFIKACDLLPNNNILNIISKARQDPYRDIILKIFNTDMKLIFKYDNVTFNYLYMNGVIDIEQDDYKSYIRFSSSFVQKRLFSFFTDEFFSEPGQIVPTFTKISHVINKQGIHIKNLLRLYEDYVKKNKDWLFKDAPRRKDLKVFEVVYHFNLYAYLYSFLTPQKAYIWPEFPTGNGKIDLIIKYLNQIYGIEIKSFSNEYAYTESIRQAAVYAKQLKINAIALVFFVENIDDEIRQKYEKIHHDSETNIDVETILIESGQ